MRKPAFYGLCVLISFSLLAITVRGVSNKHCLLPFFISKGRNFTRGDNSKKKYASAIFP